MWCGYLWRAWRRFRQCAPRLAGHRLEHGGSRDCAPTLKARLRAWSRGSRRDDIREHSCRRKRFVDPVRRRKAGMLRRGRTDLSRNFPQVFLRRAQRVRSDDEARGEHLTGNRNAGHCRSRSARRESRSNRNRVLDVLSRTAVVAPAHVGKLERAMKSDYSPQFPIRLMNKDFGLILNLAAAVGVRMPATGAAFEVNARQSEQQQEQDFSAVILQMQKQDHLALADKG